MSAHHELTPATLLGPAQIRELAEAVAITPTKKLGQNFVHDPNTVRMIVDQAGITDRDHVLEIGPGLGSLTLALLDTAASTTVCEIDPRLAAQLPDTVARFAGDHAEKLTVIQADGMTLSREHWPADHLPTALVANLPYNVSVPLLLHVLEEFPSLRTVLVMVQLEVAERLAATPGTKIYGVPSVKAAFYGEVRLAHTIGKNVFWPAPNVNSGLVRIDITDTWPRALRGEVFPLVDAAFAQRRKTLRAALSGHFGSGARAEEVLRAAGIDPTLRGEKLEVADFVRLAEVAREH
ncbi:16S rRNA (adenine(1518)-N(6)/adenine(1519)-N(6))-dimethyltransferase [Corynebacterium sp. 13CS0277]|uniref:16S rRNA (adenine(1518)-N(6)/adenine(1519)-N(6))- dimethyltransferase RsmA n=1 Tax=Corynebacterium sp. 13CS0277 TaxID=2071994 RepID=UPI000D043FF9|nr:16S rRNA (adenine(1518)-N(6)/adenine(1519)-N(6))-dimethyltransferase RsmA [Corynebacterium sp. 13CS0277]PRQ12467.1 16S rRNA (adenine(1518)-N(6)/adenine(1519)-N(6))-dimethyltransferase [Corynebacterium sp. 13CS0277]